MWRVGVVKHFDIPLSLDSIAVSLFSNYSETKKPVYLSLVKKCQLVLLGVKRICHILWMVGTLRSPAPNACFWCDYVNLSKFAQVCFFPGLKWRRKRFPRIKHLIPHKLINFWAGLFISRSGAVEFYLMDYLTQKMGQEISSRKLSIKVLDVNSVSSALEVSLLTVSIFIFRQYC